MNHHSHSRTPNSNTNTGTTTTYVLITEDLGPDVHFMDQLEPKELTLDDVKLIFKEMARVHAKFLGPKTMSKRSAAQVSDDGRNETCSSHRFGRKTRVQKCVQEDNQWMFQVSTYVRGRPFSNTKSPLTLLHLQIRDPRLVRRDATKRNLLDCRKTPCGEYALSDHWSLSWRSSTGEFLFFQRQRDR